MQSKYCTLIFERIIQGMKERWVGILKQRKDLYYKKKKNQLFKMRNRTKKPNIYNDDGESLFHDIKE